MAGQAAGASLTPGGATIYNPASPFDAGASRFAGRPAFSAAVPRRVSSARRRTRPRRIRIQGDVVSEERRCVHCRQRPIDARWRPFCSERCRLFDLGNWIDERYRVPSEMTATEDHDPIGRDRGS